jgi:transposase
MPQLILPLIPEGATQITDSVCVIRDDKRFTYFLNLTPIYTHALEDQRMFRLITSQLIDSGACRHVDIINTFGVSKSSVNRYLKKYREGGSKAFLQKRPVRKGGSVLTPVKLEQAQSLLDQNYSRKKTAQKIGVRENTLYKAILDGRLREPKPSQAATDKSTRNAIDAGASNSMGTACTRVEERVGAAFGLFEGATVRFEPSVDVLKGGVLCALPALLANGLLEGADKLLGKLKGYYQTFHILLLLAFMGLCRIKTVEQLRGYDQGEFGSIIGLDRIPEVSCLRRKLDDLSHGDAAELWAAHLSKYWMDKAGYEIGTLYVDGHVRVYHGNLTKPPRRYVSRERLCLRGTTDYWVNDWLGCPFFVVEKANDPGLLKTLENDIVPRLLKDIPHQPSQQELKENPHLCRFILVFDREGYSPVFFKKMWKEHRIGCITYHKHPDEPWPEEWFSEQKLKMPNGEEVTMRLAEMGSAVGSDKKPIWMREVRKLTESGHQTSLISTAYALPHTQLAIRMFSRWCQENFFRYMMQHFGIDLLSEYGLGDFPDTEKVVNPIWRDLDRQRNSVRSKLRYRQAKFAEMTMHPKVENDSASYKRWLKKKAELLEEIEQHEHELESLKAKLKETSKHITWAELDDADKFYRLLPGRKRLMDTVRMISYRAETAMASMMIGPTVDMAAARRLLQDLFVNDADILPETENNILRIRIHNAARPASNRHLEKLLEQLNATETVYPGTQMTIKYEMRGETT